MTTLVLSMDLRQYENYMKRLGMDPRTTSHVMVTSRASFFGRPTGTPVEALQGWASRFPNELGHIYDAIEAMGSRIKYVGD